MNATLTPTDDGPLSHQRGITLLDAHGNHYEVSDTIALCRCRHSNTKPFCDGTHETTSFAAVNPAATSIESRAREPKNHGGTAGAARAAGHPPSPARILKVLWDSW